MGEITRVRARPAQHLPVFNRLATVTDDLAASAADNFSTGRSRQIARIQFYLYLLDPEQNTVRHPFVSFQLTG
jgi:hypothetical protein